MKEEQINKIEALLNTKEISCSMRESLERKLEILKGSKIVKK